MTFGNGISAEIRLNISVTSPVKYRCEFTTKEDKICAKTLEVDFEGNISRLDITQLHHTGDWGKFVTSPFLGNCYSGDSDFKADHLTHRCMLLLQTSAELTLLSCAKKHTYEGQK